MKRRALKFVKFERVWDISAEKQLHFRLSENNISVCKANRIAAKCGATDVDVSQGNKINIHNTLVTSPLLPNSLMITITKSLCGILTWQAHPFQEIAAVDSAVPLHFGNNFVLYGQICLNQTQGIHMYETRGRANYRTGRHPVYERLPSQAGVNFLNRLSNSIKHAPTPKALKTRLNNRFLVSLAFYNAGEFLAFDWETAQLED
ncbi:hypothetical protein J6590_037927 [Homalodisca vitripennis]|nr:hypothetical protein J6590_037927 [Homalodisca vitripennis]